MEKDINDIIKCANKEFKTSKKYKISDDFNIESLNVDYDKSYGIVYIFYLDSFKKDNIRYIGKSKGKYFKTRLKAHLFDIGTGTSSKFEFIKREGNVYLCFIQTKPESLRNLKKKN